MAVYADKGDEVRNHVKWIQPAIRAGHPSASTGLSDKGKRQVEWNQPAIQTGHPSESTALSDW